MVKQRSKSKGWKNERYRHSLAARGIKSGRKGYVPKTRSFDDKFYAKGENTIKRKKDGTIDFDATYTDGMSEKNKAAIKKHENENENQEQADSEYIDQYKTFFENQGVDVESLGMGSATATKESEPVEEETDNSSHDVVVEEDEPSWIDIGKYDNDGPEPEPESKPKKEEYEPVFPTGEDDTNWVEDEEEPTIADSLRPTQQQEPPTTTTFPPPANKPYQHPKKPRGIPRQTSTRINKYNIGEEDLKLIKSMFADARVTGEGLIYFNNGNYLYPRSYGLAANPKHKGIKAKLTSRAELQKYLLDEQANYPNGR